MNPIGLVNFLAAVYNCYNLLEKAGDWLIQKNPRSQARPAPGRWQDLRPKGQFRLKWCLDLVDSLKFLICF